MGSFATDTDISGGSAQHLAGRRLETINSSWLDKDLAEDSLESSKGRSKNGAKVRPAVSDRAKIFDPDPGYVENTRTRRGTAPRAKHTHTHKHSQTLAYLHAHTHCVHTRTNSGINLRQTRRSRDALRHMMKIYTRQRLTMRKYPGAPRAHNLQSALMFRP